MAFNWFWNCNLRTILNEIVISGGIIFISLVILLDANFLLIPAQFGVDIFQELDRLVSKKFELTILNKTIEELKNLAKYSLKRQKEVQIALELAKKCKIIEIESSKDSFNNVDDIILHLAVINRWIVATNDRKLRKKLRANQISVIYLRKKAILDIDGEIPL